MRISKLFPVFIALAVLITACKGKQITDVTVNVGDRNPVPVTLTVSPDSIKLLKGDSYPLAGVVTAPAGYSTAIYWSSNNLGIATVSSTGVVTAIGDGSTLIIAKAVADTTKKDTVKVVVFTPPPPPVIAVTINVTPDSSNILKGGMLQLAAQVTGLNDKPKTVTWRSLNTSTATVSSSGLVTGVNVGLARIVGIADADTTKRDTVKVVVYSPPPSPQVWSISITPHRMDLKVGQNANGLVTVVADSGITKAFHCVSMNAAVVTAVFEAPSNCKITAIALNPLGEDKGIVVYVETDAVHPTLGKLRDSLLVYVTPATLPPVSVSIRVTPDSIRILRTTDYQLNAVVTAPAGQSTAIIWSSNNPAVATVSSSGLVLAQADGLALIIVKAVADTTKRDTTKVVVFSPPPPLAQLRSISITPSRMDLVVGQSSNAAVTVVADAGVSTTFTCHSTNSALVSAVFVAPSSCKVTALAVNPNGASFPTQIYAETDASHPTLGKLKAGLNVYVTSPPPPPVPVTISVSPDSIRILRGSTYQPTGVVTAPAGQSTAINWLSNNTGIATVSASGLITGVSDGFTLVIASAVTDPSKKDTVKVVVYSPPPPPPVPVTITVLPDSTNILRGATYQLVGVVTAPAGQVTSVTWRSLNTSTATVSSTGLVTGVNVGLARIVGIADADTMKRDTVKVVVNTPPQVRSISITPTRLDLKVGLSLNAAVTVVVDVGVPATFTCHSTNPALVSAVFVAPSSCKVTAIAVNPNGVNFSTQIYAETDAVHPTLGKLKAGSNVFVTPP